MQYMFDFVYQYFGGIAAFARTTSQYQLPFSGAKMETLFSLSNLLTIPFWLLMILLPDWAWTKRIMRSLWTVVPAALLYALLVIPRVPTLLGDLANPELATIAALLGTPAGATIGWVHFLAFDLFVGRWAYLDSREHGFSAWIISPLLFVILMFGPLGLLLYLAARTLLLRRPA
jgi:hypothetical protein